MRPSDPGAPEPLRDHLAPYVISSLVFLFLWVAGPVPAADWPMFRGGPALDGVTEDRLPDDLALHWTFPAGDAVKSSAAVAGGVAVFGTTGGSIHAVDAVTGEAKWSLATEGAIEATPLIMGDRVFVGSGDGFFYALDRDTGKVAWKQETGDQILGAATYFTEDDTTSILVGSYDYHLYCFDAASGEIRWKVETENYVNGAPAVEGGKVVFGGCDGELRVVDVRTGAARPAIPIGEYIAGSAALADGVAYFGHYGNEVVAVDLAKGVRVWTFQGKGFPYYSSPAIAGDLVVIGGRDKALHALDRTRGTSRWIFRTRGKVDSSPAVAGERVAVGSEDGRLYVCDLQSGEQIWVYDLGEGTVASPAISGGRIYIGANNGTMFCFGSAKTVPAAAPVEVPASKPAVSDDEPGAATSDDRLTTFGAASSRSADAVDEDWPRFLGPRHAMVSGETRLRRSWDETGPRLLWQVEKGEGYSGPVVAGGKLVTMHRLEGEEVVECRDAVSGRRLWDDRYPTTYRDRYGFNGGPRASPCIEGNRVVTYGVQGRLHAYDLATGARLWERDLETEYELVQDFFGVGTSPVIYEGAVLVNVGARAGPCLAAFDLETGESLWGAGDGWAASYATPVIASLHDRTKVLVFAGGDSRPPTGGLLVVDLEKRTEDGRFPWRSTKYESANASSPVVIGDRVYISYSIRDRGAMVRVRPDGAMDEIWSNRSLGAYWMTPVHHDGYLYGIDGRHIPEAELVCLDAATGAAMWREKVTWSEPAEDRPDEVRTIGAARGHLLRADGSFLCLGEYGHLLWMDLDSSGLTITARSRLFLAPETFTPPVLSHGLLYVMQNHASPEDGSPPRLLCYDLRAGT